MVLLHNLILVVLHIFVETIIHFYQGFLMNRNTNITTKKVFTVISDQFNASLLNKS